MDRKVEERLNTSELSTEKLEGVAGGFGRQLLCPQCGANIQNVPFTADTAKCNSCGWSGNIGRMTELVPE